uniref:Uncharacterized protein n=1 Tax=Clytia hemisphaerica TaxID=252671 RepID=A0A7M5WU25_9CNID|eukprot:TCONS_00057434-protein
MNGQPRQAKSFSSICEGNTAKKIKLMEEKSHAFTESCGKILRKRSLSTPNVSPSHNVERQRLAARRVKKVKRRAKNTNVVQDQRKRYGCCFDSFDIDLTRGIKSPDDSEYEEIDQHMGSFPMFQDSDKESHYRLLYTIPEEEKFYMESSWNLCDLTEGIDNAKYTDDNSNDSFYENENENMYLKCRNNNLEKMDSSLYENEDGFKWKNNDFNASLCGNNEEQGFYEEMFGQYDDDEGGEHVYEYINEEEGVDAVIHNAENSPLVEFLNGQKITDRRNYTNIDLILAPFEKKLNEMRT